ncbi:hypothetical protein DCMF_27930 [Candidatus Formimonas warabiya]|uniref:DUF4097 domain-containing protein n=2 Tax=Formimonas warabiya TaxID=1761012 RepID=A0A3G1L0A1_FORW1|nr:hypothetical protein DCMF_27930 [Candidatus Formimonas warabiya]
MIVFLMDKRSGGEVIPEETVSGSIVTEPFSAIEMQNDVADINILYGNEYSVGYTTYEHPICTIKEGKLVIANTVEGGFVADVGKILSDIHITITVPQDVILDSIVIDSKIGKIKVDSMNAQQITVNGEMGLIHMPNIICTGLNVENKAGDVVVSGVVDGNIDIWLQTGNISLNLPKSQEKYIATLGSGLGNVILNDKSVSVVKRQGDGPYQMIAQVNIGDVVIKMD